MGEQLGFDQMLREQQVPFCLVGFGAYTNILSCHVWPLEWGPCPGKDRDWERIREETATLHFTYGSGWTVHRDGPLAERALKLLSPLLPSVTSSKFWPLVQNDETVGSGCDDRARIRYFMERMSRDGAY